MSNGRDNLAGSSARHHEQTGGNVQAGKMPLPAGGDAARKAETEGDLINEAHGIRTAPRGEYRSAMQLNLPRVVGARLVEPEKPPADLSERKASDYLPPDLKARLTAEGKLAPDTAPVASAPAPGRAAETDLPVQRPVESAGKPTRGPLVTVGRFFRKLFGSVGV